MPTVENLGEQLKAMDSKLASLEAKLSESLVENKELKDYIKKEGQNH
jgi:hypothetical protein